MKLNSKQPTISGEAGWLSAKATFEMDMFCDTVHTDTPNCLC